jgi:Ca-activated chloride channel family protein
VNVIRFDNHYDALFPASRPADPLNLQSAARFVRSMLAHGGTEMSPALAAAFSDPGLPVAVRQVVFVTDGAVAGEETLFQLIERQLGRTRLFPVGIGSAPNRYFLERAARYGRGATVAIAQPSEVGARMDELLDKIEQPILSDLQVHWNDEVEMWPERLPDVHAGDPLVITARLARHVGDIALAARRADSPWQARIALTRSRDESGVAKLWARRKIAALMDARRRGLEPEAMRKRVIETALAHHLVSRFTSLVSVDATPARPEHTPLASHALPGSLPTGTTPQAFGGVLPRTATLSPFLLYAGVLCCALSVFGLRIQERLR